MIEEAVTETTAEETTAIAVVVDMDEMEAEIGGMMTEATEEGMEGAILTATAMTEEVEMIDEATATNDDGMTTANANPSPRCPKRTSPKLLQQQPRRSTHKHTPGNP
jgi:hypothetical protein